jgi:hypothetical protein
MEIFLFNEIGKNQGNKKESCLHKVPPPNVPMEIFLFYEIGKEVRK